MATSSQDIQYLWAFSLYADLACRRNTIIQEAVVYLSVTAGLSNLKVCLWWHSVFLWAHEVIIWYLTRTLCAACFYATYQTKVIYLFEKPPCVQLPVLLCVITESVSPLSRYLLLLHHHIIDVFMLIPHCIVSHRHTVILRQMCADENYIWYIWLGCVIKKTFLVTQS